MCCAACTRRPSLTEVRARVLGVVNETSDTKTFVLRPNALWRGAQPGQHVLVQVEVNGRRHSRAYSLSRIAAGEAAITVKRQGLVSAFLHEQVRPGQVLTLSQAQGDFVLPAGVEGALPAKLLFLSAGSGITPVMALRDQLLASGYQGDLKFLHISRHEMIFGAQLQGADVHHHRSSVDGRFDIDTLRALVPDWAERATWLCGPRELMDVVHALWAEHPGAAPLHSERFGAALRPVQALGSPVQVQFARSGAQFSTAGSAPVVGTS